MNRMFFACAIVAVGLFSCKKDKKVCTESIIPIGGYAGFKGFDTSELRLVIRRTYVADGQFNQLLQTDTLATDSLLILDDTARSVYQHTHVSFLKVSLDSGKHYEVEIPAATRTYRIAGVFYRGSWQVVYDQGDYGCRRRGFLKGADSTVVDGAPVMASASEGPAKVFFLVK